MDFSCSSSESITILCEPMENMSLGPRRAPAPVPRKSRKRRAVSPIDGSPEKRRWTSIRSAYPGYPSSKRRHASSSPSLSPGPTPAKRRKLSGSQPPQHAPADCGRTLRIQCARFAMSTMDKTSRSIKSKLRGNDVKKYPYQSYSDSSAELQSMPGLIDKPHQSKCGGRGIIMKQLLEESKKHNSNGFMKTSKLDFSNSNIEQHFKQLQEKNEKKFKEENEVKWKDMFNSNKRS